MCGAFNLINFTASINANETTFSAPTLPIEEDGNRENLDTSYSVNTQENGFNFTTPKANEGETNKATTSKKDSEAMQGSFAII